MKLYHVSKKYLGGEITLTPKVPVGQSLAEYRSKHRYTPRISCSDTVAKCLLGITEMKQTDTMYVYETIGRIDVDWDSPRNCCDDWDITDEAWLVDPTKFKFVRTIVKEKK